MEHTKLTVFRMNLVVDNVNGLELLVLDEINVAVSFGLIELDEVVAFVKGKPERLELILTGRYAPDELIELADTVTEMREIKHHYQKGVKARKGIEY